MTDESSTATFLALRLRLRTAAASILRNNDDADDALQELFVRTWQSGTETRDSHSYLFASLRNICIDMLRRRKNTAGQSSTPLDTAVDTATRIESRDTIEHVRRFVEHRLSGLPRNVFELYVYDQLDYDEIAARLGISIEATRTAMSRARKTIRQNFKR